MGPTFVVAHAAGHRRRRRGRRARLLDRARDLRRARRSGARHRGARQRGRRRRRSTTMLHDTIALIAPRDLLAAAAPSAAISTSSRQVARLQPGIRELCARSARAGCTGTDRERSRARARALTEGGRAARPRAPRRESRAICTARRTSSSSRRPRKLSVEAAARVYFGVGAALGLDWLRDQIEHSTSRATGRPWRAAACARTCTRLHRELTRARARETRARDPRAALRPGRVSGARDSSRTCAHRRRHALADRQTLTSPSLSVALQAVRRLTSPRR